MNRYKLILCVLLCVSCASCATTRKMALKAVNSIDLTRESLVLMTLRLDNRNVPKYKPQPYFASFWEVGADKPKKYKLKIGNPVFDDAPAEYLISMQVPAGKYTFREIIGMSGNFPVSGQFVMPLYTDFRVYPDEIVYIGHIEGVVVKREKGEELRAGPPIPLIDQLITGFGNGTFRINISNDYHRDVAKFKREYPLLEDAYVANRVMSAWEQPSKEIISGKGYKPKE